jgi:excisionase family DNA binding protein
MSDGPTSTSGLWDVQQVAEWLGVSRAWIRDHATRKQPRIPHIKLGKLLKFRPEEVEQFIAALSLNGDAA